MRVASRRVRPQSASMDDNGEQSRRPGRPRDEGARQAILKAAINLLRAGKLPTISADAIADRAGVSKATIYRWWPNKSAIIMEGFLEMIAPHIQFPKTASAMDDLRVQLCRVTEVCRGDIGRMLRALVADSQANTELASAMQHNYFSVRRADARQVIERGIAAGEFRRDIDIDAAIDCVYGPILYRLLISPTPPSTKFVNRMMALLQRAFMAKA